MITFLAYANILIAVVFVLFLFFKKNKTQTEFYWMSGSLVVQMFFSVFVALGYLRVL